MRIRTTLAIMAMLGVAAPALAESAPHVERAPELPSVWHRENLPTAAATAGSPTEWTTYAAHPGRNAVFPGGGAHRWRFAGAGALPLNGPPLNGDVRTTAYTVGMPVGVSLAGGVAYVGSDNGYAYAMNARTGKPVWARPLWNMAMSNPLVAEGLVFYATGNPYFNGANTAKVARGERAVRGPGLNGIYALDARTGEERWRFLTAGQNMPTPVLVDDLLIFSNGDGHAYALDARTGALRWKQDVVSINGMSSLAAGEGLVYFGGSRPGKFYALEARTGRVAWTWSDRALSANGMGDATPAYAEGIVVESTVLATGQPETPVVGAVLALEAKSGRELWRRTFSSGRLKPGMSTGTPVVHGGRVYVSSPIDGRLRALDLRTGAVTWQTELAGLGPAGGAVAEGRLYLPHADGRVSVLDQADGRVLTSFRVGGRFGPTSPVIWGRTIYLANMYGWVTADPLPALEPRR